MRHPGGRCVKHGEPPVLSKRRKGVCKGLGGDKNHRVDRVDRIDVTTQRLECKGERMADEGKRKTAQKI